MFDPIYAVKLYEDLSQEQFELGWFPEYVSQESFSVVQDLACVEIRVHGLNDDDDAYDIAMRELEKVLWIVLHNAFSSQKLLAVEYKPQPVSGIRTIDGFLARQPAISMGRSLEKEKIIEGSRSFFVALADVRQENERECFKMMLDSSQTCILSFPERSHAQFYEDLINETALCVTVDGVVRIDYTKLIPVLCRRLLAVTTFGVDVRGEFVNFRSFSKRKMCRGLYDVAKAFHAQRV